MRRFKEFKQLVQGHPVNQGVRICLEANVRVMERRQC